MPLTDEEAMTLVALHGASWHHSVNAQYPGWGVWNSDAGEGANTAWRDLVKPTLGEACRDYCKRHGLGKE